MEIEVRVFHQTPLEPQPKIRAVCCREWDCAVGYGNLGRCGLCGQTPVPIGGGIYT